MPTAKFSEEDWTHIPAQPAEAVPLVNVDNARFRFADLTSYIHSLCSRISIYIVNHSFKPVANNGIEHLL